MNKIILVTGISSGFGKAIAGELSRRGHIVYGTVRQCEERLEGVNYLTADVRDDSQVAAAVQTVIDEQGRIDVLINNAGMGVGGPSEFVAMEEVRRQIDVNFLGLVRMVQAVLPHMRKAGRGTIMAMSSIGGRLGLPFQSYYSASKFAVEGFCEGLRMEVREHGIKVVVIEPGDFHTGFTLKRSKVDNSAAIAAYPSYEHSMSSAEHDELSGLTPEYLASRVARIAECPSPRCNYMIATAMQKSSVFLKSILPPMWFSRLIAWFYKIS